LHTPDGQLGFDGGFSIHEIKTDAIYKGLQYVDIPSGSPSSSSKLHDMG